MTDNSRQFKPKFDSAGLITAIAQDQTSKEVLMVAHMNQEALDKTIKTGIAHYWSRSRNCLWKKGETSGQLQEIVDLRLDCDGDAILLLVAVGGDGGACHTGFRSCFYRHLNDDRTLDIAEDAGPAPAGFFLK